MSLFKRPQDRLVLKRDLDREICLMHLEDLEDTLFEEDIRAQDQSSGLMDEVDNDQDWIDLECSEPVDNDVFVGSYYDEGEERDSDFYFREIIEPL